MYKKNHIAEQTFGFEIKIIIMNKCCVCGTQPQSVDHCKSVKCERIMSWCCFCTACYNNNFKRSMFEPSISQKLHDKRLWTHAQTCSSFRLIRIKHSAQSNIGKIPNCVLNQQEKPWGHINTRLWLHQDMLRYMLLLFSATASY